MQFSPLICYLVPLRPKYCPQQPILKSPHPKFLPQSERPSFTPIQNNRKNYSSVGLNFFYFYFWAADWKTKDSAPNGIKHFLTSICFYFFLNGILICYSYSQFAANHYPHKLVTMYEHTVQLAPLNYFQWWNCSGAFVVTIVFQFIFPEDGHIGGRNILSVIQPKKHDYNKCI